MPGHDIVCIGASAVAINSLFDLLRALLNIPASLFNVVHSAPEGRGRTRKTNR